MKFSLFVSFSAHASGINIFFCTNFFCMVSYILSILSRNWKSPARKTCYSGLNAQRLSWKYLFYYERIRFLIVLFLLLCVSRPPREVRRCVAISPATISLKPVCRHFSQDLNGPPDMCKFPEAQALLWPQLISKTNTWKWVVNSQVPKPAWRIFLFSLVKRR